MDPWARQEMAGAKVPDRRYKESAANIAERLAEGGSASYSQALDHDGRQAARRLFMNDGVTVDGLLQGHYEQTGARCRAYRRVLAVQDTTTIDYTSHRAKEGFGPVDTTGRTRGLMAHSVLALSPDGQPLGVLGLDLWVRGENTPGPNYADRTKRTEEKESGKWLRGLQAVKKRVPAKTQVVLIQDREGDIFPIFATKRRKTVHLLVRARFDRAGVLTPESGREKRHLMEAAAKAPVVGAMTVTVPRAPRRKEREATLTVRSTCATVPCPAWRKLERFPAQSLWLVDAREEEPPTGQEGVHWVLITTLAVKSAEDACRMVRYYALRWTIERLHYVLKSGCRVERLQIDACERLKKALAIYWMVAWRLMYLTYLARTDPDLPAQTALTPEEITVLAEATKRPVTTVYEAVVAIAILGGYEHYRNAPPPGPKRLWMGLRRLEDMVIGWMLAHSPPQKDVNQD